MMEDDCLCEYDSTWDTESDGDEPERRAGQDKNKTWTLFHPTPRNMRAAKDMQNYRRSYPNLTDDECSEDKMNNLKFYLNQFPSAPDDVYIESFHKEWKTDYKRLERVHSYIQWLFPLREPGVNYMASELTKKEIEAFKKSEEAGRRLVESYELMLGFYGMQLVNRDTGEVRRAENWKERFGNLERNMHNNLRITRILKSLGELGLEHYQAPLVHFFLEETLVKKTLGSVKRSVLDYFLFAVRDKQERQELLRFAYLHFEPKDKFVWCPRKIQKQLKRAEKRAEAAGNADGRDDVTLRAKGKDGEAGAPPKDEMGVVDTSPEAQKETDKAASGNKDKHSEGSSEPKPDAGTIGNGNAEAESEEEPLEDGSGCEGSEDVEEMDRSSPETMQTKPEANIDGGDSAKSKDPNQDPVKSAKPDGEAESEKPQKKKREDDDEVLPGNSSLAVDLVNGQTEESVPDNNPSGPTAPSASTPLKTKPEGSSKHLASPSSGRKIARTDFIHVLDNGKEGRELAQDTRVDQQEGASAPSRAPTSADHDQQEGASAPSRAPTSADHDQQEGASAPSRAPTSADTRVGQQEGASAPSRAPTSTDTRVDQQEGASAPSRAPTSTDTRVDQQEGASAPSRAPTSADYDQQANGKDSEEMDVESSLPTSNQDTGDS